MSGRRKPHRGSYVDTSEGRLERERLDNGSLLWVPDGALGGRYELAEVTHRDSSILKLQLLADGRAFALDLDEPDVDVLKANRGLAEDMTELRHLHLPGILHNLRERALADEPYTFLGSSVLVAVNPLKPLPEPPGALGEKEALREPHPFAIAEGAYQQLCFGAARAGKQQQQRRSKGGGAAAAVALQAPADAPVNQSILVGGESGAGKTESSKMVLRHLVHRCLAGAEDEQDLDRRLLDSNPILEAFGNAATARNHNSSRHGRSFRLFFAPASAGAARGAGNSKRSGRAGRGQLVICGAAVETYLLERSRVTAHSSEGERTFHVFYQLLAGASKTQRRAYDLDRRFAYTVPRSRDDEDAGGGGRLGGDGKPKARRPTRRQRSMRMSRRQLESADASNFATLCTALETIGVPAIASRAAAGAVTQDHLFAALAALLHLGNLTFRDDGSGTAGEVAVVEDEAPLARAATLLGVDPQRLRRLFVERRVRAGGEDITATRDAHSAKDAVDAVAKKLYALMFDWLVLRISDSLGGSANRPEERAGAGGGEWFISVLDIFGFESFQNNDLEQLLINYANEALQSSFNRAVFDAEAALYEREGLLVAGDERTLPADNAPCMALLRGDPAPAGAAAGAAGKRARRPGLLSTIDAEGRAPQPLDEKMNDALHRAFGKHPCFVAPHPRERRTVFIVKHFAGEVKYTVGRFLEKNSDKVPGEVATLFADAASPLVCAVFAAEAAAEARAGSGEAGRAARVLGDSIISRFVRQIDALVDTLDQTRCSFIRCVKPNPHMLREAADAAGSWFDDSFVELQLENLSIPQTTQVLQGGFPTRVPFETLLEGYVGILPEAVLRVWRTLGGGDDRAFVTALFFAFEIEPRFYKLGLTKVFFRSGMLERLSAVLDAVTAGDLDDGIVLRFRRSFARQLWRKTLAKVRAVLAFEALLEFSRARNGAATILQRVARRKLAEAEAKAELARLREARRAESEADARRRAKESRRREKAARRAAEAAEAQRLREAEALREEQQRQEEFAREQEELARAAAAEKQRVHEFRVEAERGEREARRNEQQQTRRTVSELGGEEAYIAQKQLERSITFSPKVRVREFKAYFSQEHVSHMSGPPAYDDTQGAREDLEALAPLVRVVTADGVVLAAAAVRAPPPHPSVRAAAAAAGPVPSSSAAAAAQSEARRASVRSMRKGSGVRGPAADGDGGARRRSYAPSRSLVRTAEESRSARESLLAELGGSEDAELTLGKLSCHDVQCCVEFALPSRGRGSDAAAAAAAATAEHGDASAAARRADKPPVGARGAGTLTRTWMKSLLRRPGASAADKSAPPRVPAAPGGPRAQSSGAQPGRMARRASGPVYVWMSCFLLLQGFQLRWYRKFVADPRSGEERGVAELGRVDADSVLELERFEPGARVLKLRKEPRVDNILRLGVRGRPGFRLVLRFADAGACELWAQRLEAVLAAHSEERKAVKRFWRGEHKDDVAMQEYRAMLAAGVISKREFKAAMSQQPSTDAEYVEQAVALLGEDVYDKRVVCEDCRAVNFLVQPDDDGGFWCHGCGVELFPPGADGVSALARGGARPLLAAVDEQRRADDDDASGAPAYAGSSRRFGRSKSKASLTPSRSTAASTGSAAAATGAAAAGSSATGTTVSLPMTVRLPDQSQLTVFEGELLPRLRLDVRTQTRKYFYSFRCQFRNRHADSELQHWHLDRPFDAFESLDAAVREYAREWNYELRVPTFRDAEYCPDAEERARLRLVALNAYVAEFLDASTREPLIFQASPVRIFFNLRSVQVAPLSLDELTELRDAFDSFANFTRSARRATRELMQLYQDVSALYPRIEASADEEIVFNTTEHAIARLTHQQKGEIFRMAQDYLQVLQAFEQRILAQLA